MGQLTWLIPILSIGILTISFITALINQPGYMSSASGPSNSGSSQESFSWWHVLEGFLGGAAGVFVAILVFYAQIRQDRNKEIERGEKDRKSQLCRVCNSIKAELEDHWRMLDGDEFSARTVTNPPLKTINYRNVYLNTEIFDSIANSGYLLVISEFDKQRKIMQNLSDLYVRIKKHNEIIGYRTRHRDEYYLHDKCASRWDNWKKEFKSYEVYLTGIETEIKQYLKGVEGSIEGLLKEF